MARNSAKYAAEVFTGLEAFLDRDPVVAQMCVAVKAVGIGLNEGIERRQFVEEILDAELDREIRHQAAGNARPLCAGCVAEHVASHDLVVGLSRNSGIALGGGDIAVGSRELQEDGTWG